MPRQAILETRTRLPLDARGQLNFAVVADTHSAPHPQTLERLRALAPDAILHAGDIGDLDVLDDLATVAPVLAVRGNIDVRAASLPDVLVIDVTTRDEPALRILMTHIAVNGPRLRADVARLAKAREAAIVVCGHSHVPLIAPADRASGAAVFNPGSVGPRRFHLPIVFGQIRVTLEGVKFEHIDVATGSTWKPGRVVH